MAADVSGDPCPQVLQNGRFAGGVEHQQKAPVRQMEDEPVIHHTTAVIRQKGVDTPARTGKPDIIRDDALQPAPRFGPFNKDLGHVGDVEHPRPLPDGTVLLHNGREHERQAPSRELRHPGSRRCVHPLER
jgi:hypothetical protein